MSSPDKDSNHLEISKDDARKKEIEQTQKLLVGLVDELFDKIEKLNKKKEISQKEKQVPKNSQKSKKIEKKESGIEFTDISWYTEKLKKSSPNND